MDYVGKAIEVIRHRHKRKTCIAGVPVTKGKDINHIRPSKARLYVHRF